MQKSTIIDPILDCFATIQSDQIGQRIDKIAAQLFPQYSRSRLQRWIQAGQISQNQLLITDPDHIVRSEGIICVRPSAADTILQDHAQPGAVDVVHEDETILVINKPAGLVVHPGAGQPDSTLLNLLLYHWPELAALPRAGLIHRLDKGTTGLLLVAKTLPTHNYLTQALAQRRVQREYIALVHGNPPADVLIEKPIGRDRRNRLRMAVCNGGRPASTYWRKIAQYSHCAHLRVSLGTGRTHQIRVHCSVLGYPLVGDRLYGGRTTVQSQDVQIKSRVWERPALHAHRLCFMHPMLNTNVQYMAPLPDDLQMMLAALSQAPG